MTTKLLETHLHLVILLVMLTYLNPLVQGLLDAAVNARSTAISRFIILPFFVSASRIHCGNANLNYSNTLISVSLTQSSLQNQVYS